MRLSLGIGLVLTTLFCGSGVVRADALAEVQSLRGSGCAGAARATPPLRRSSQLDHAAQLWADGTAMGAAVDRSGYAARKVAAIHLSGPNDTATQTLRNSHCRNLTDFDLRDIGVYRHGLETWLILASPYSSLSTGEAPQVAARVLSLVNAARAHGAHCGARDYPAAPPVRLSMKLVQAAASHAIDMAENRYLEHRDRAGHSPAERVRAAGFRDRAVGENIALGPTSAEEVVQGWMQSPGHCENIMDSRFTEMGLSYAPDRSLRHELYWVQLMAQPQA